MKLRRCHDGLLMGTKVTSGGGFFLFSTELENPSSTDDEIVYLEFVLPPGYSFAPKDAGSDEEKDSDVDATTGRTVCTHIACTPLDDYKACSQLWWDAGLVLNPPPLPPPITNPGTGTPGFWKNHPEAWPATSIVIGGVTYTQATALFWLGQKDGDKTVTLFRALVCAKLNVLIGNDPSCIATAIGLADDWFAVYGPVGSNVKAKSTAWTIGEVLNKRLDDYNNGLLCAPPRD